jgi:hypothetical protein
MNKIRDAVRLMNPDETTMIELVEMIYDLFNQSCQTGFISNRPVFHHMCISAYEDAQDFLIQHGIIDGSQCEYL